MKTYFSVAVTLAALTLAGTSPVFAQSLNQGSDGSLSPIAYTTSQHKKIWNLAPTASNNRADVRKNDYRVYDQAPDSQSVYPGYPGGLGGR
jgi:hypothetical protein